MKIAISATGEKPEDNVDPRFGRCQFFHFVDLESGQTEVVQNPNVQAPTGAGIATAQFVVDKGANVAITGNIGPNAYNVLSANKVEAITGLQGTVKEAIEKFKKGELKEGSPGAPGIGMGLGRGMGRRRGIGRVASQGGSTAKKEDTKTKRSKPAKGEKVCIPTMGQAGLDEQVSPHFGRAPTFTIVDTATDEVDVINNSSEHMGGIGKPPEHLKKEGVTVMLCSGMGPRAIEMFAEFGIGVFTGAQGKVKGAIEDWMAGMLTPASEETACKEHKS